MIDLKPLVHAVADARADYSDKSDELAALRREFDTAHFALITEVKALAEDVSEKEATLRAALLACGKGKHLGGEVKEFQTIAYDQAEALAWATEHAMCLALDKKAFEKVAKASPPPCVTVGTELRASLASNMTAALSEQ